MLNKNSAHRTVFHRLKVGLLLLFILEIVYSQACLQYSGGDCTQCASGYQLVSGGCVSNLGGTNDPILIFKDIPGVQKVLYSVSPVILILSSSSGQQQAQQNVVSEFQVVKVSNSAPGNYYEVRTNSTSAVKDVNKLFTDSSVLKEVNQSGQIINKTVSLKANTSNNILVKQSNESKIDESSLVNLTAIKKSNQEATSSQLNLTAVKQLNSSSPVNFTLIKQSSPTEASLTSIKQVSQQVDPNLTLVMQSENITLTEAKEANQSNQEVNLTKVNINDQQVPPAQKQNITTSNQNNSQLLLQLQQINQKLTQVGQSFTLTQAKMNQPNISTPVVLTQVTQAQQMSNIGGAITLQLTQVGQKLTQINQQLTQAKLTTSTQSNDQSSATNNTDQSSPSLTLIQPSNSKNQTKIQLNISQFQLPRLQSQSQQGLEPKFTEAKQVIDINWIKATRYELYNLTLVSQALTQAKLRQPTSPGTILTFKCNKNITLLISPTQKPSSSLQSQYVKYLNAIKATTSKQLQQYTQADNSTLCLDPPFHKCIQHLFDRHSVIRSLPIISVYYQFCGFAKNFRVFFLDDSSLPKVTVYAGEVVVDLFRMMPAEVFLSNYNQTILQQ